MEERPPPPDVEPLAGANAPAPPPTAPSAALFALTLALLFLPGLLAQAAAPAAGLLWTELFAFLLPAAALAAAANLRPAPLLGLQRPPPATLRLALLAGVGALVLGAGVMSLTALAFPSRVVEATDVTRIFDAPGWRKWLTVATAALLAPICEELAFRGHLQTALLARRRPGQAILLGALFFGALHLDPIRLPALVVLGALFGWLAWRAGSVWPAVVAHAVNNGVTTAMALAGRDDSGERPGAGASLLLVAVGLLLLAPILAAYRRATPTPPRMADRLVAIEPASPTGVPTFRRLPAWALAALTVGAAALGLLVLAGR